MDWSELQNWEEYTKLLIALLALTDPFSAIPVLSGLIQNFSLSDKKATVLVAVLTYTVTLVVFLFFGSAVLTLFGITIAAFKIAGGIMFLFYALEMLGLIKFPTLSGEVSVSNSTKSIGISPIGIPLLAGPGAISTIIIHANDHAAFSHKIVVVGVIVSMALIIYLMFRTTLLVGHRLGETSTMIMNKVMGLMLAAIAVEFILDGIVAHFPQLLSIH